MAVDRLTSGLNAVAPGLGTIGNGLATAAPGIANAARAATRTIDNFAGTNLTSALGFQGSNNSAAVTIPPELENLVNSSNGAITIQRGGNGEITAIDFTTDYQKMADALTNAVGTGNNPIKNAVDLFGLIQRYRLNIPISINGELQGIEEQSSRLIGSLEKLISKNKTPYSFSGTYAETTLGFFESMSVPGNQIKYFGSSENYQRVKNSIADAAVALQTLANTAADGAKNAKDGIAAGGKIATDIGTAIGKISGGGAAPAG